MRSAAGSSGRLSASDTVGPLNNLFTAVCLNRASDSREPLAVAANPLSEDDTQTAENWDACWNALESLPAFEPRYGGARRRVECSPAGSVGVARHSVMPPRHSGIISPAIPG